MANVTYRMDHKGFQELAESKSVGAAMLQVAQEGARWAQSVSPVKNGAYRDAFVTGLSTNRTLRRNQARAGAYLANTAPHAPAVERRHAILARGAAQMSRGS